MRFVETALAGAWLLELEPRSDERGFFARSFDQAEFAARGLSSEVVQCSISFNEKPATLRGMHYQAAPHGECKLIRCTRGAVYDVIIDLRAHSKTHGQWIATELSADNRRALYVPAGFAHGFQTLTAHSELHYQISTPYHAEAARGVRWNDPAFAIEWPPAERILSARDAAFADYRGDA